MTVLDIGDYFRNLSKLEGQNWKSLNSGNITPKRKLKLIENNLDGQSPAKKQNLNFENLRLFLENEAGSSNLKTICENEILAGTSEIGTAQHSTSESENTGPD